MKKFATIFAVLYLFCFFTSVSYAQNIKEEAQSSYNSAIQLKAKGDGVGAVKAFEKALRLDRTVLALDDDGLVDMLKEYVEKELERAPKEVKLLETMGFIQAVCFSDNAAAIGYYEQVIELVDDKNVKEKTRNLIDRLKATEEMLASYRGEVTAQLRDERLRAWSEMEKNEKFAEEQYEKDQRASNLQQAFSDREELQNIVPQLEDELAELQEAYDKANRLWFSLKDELYERRRRRLKDDISAKEAELSKAKSQLNSAERLVSSLESEIASSEEKDEDSPFRSYDSPRSSNEYLNDATYAPYASSNEDDHNYDATDDEQQAASDANDHSDHSEGGDEYDDEYDLNSGTSLSDLIDSL
jgi:vacuolar-type H+-ATPase subunit I/STV1